MFKDSKIGEFLQFHHTGRLLQESSRVKSLIDEIEYGVTLLIGRADGAFIHSFDEIHKGNRVEELAVGSLICKAVPIDYFDTEELDPL